MGTKPSLAIGWDVGGWLGRKQGVAVIELYAGSWRYIGEPRCFRARDLAGGSVMALIRAGWPDAPDDLLERYRIAVAIDSPLAFPIAFQRLLNGDFPQAPQPAREIESLLAYRACDRYVAAEHRKKPLSASFDKLGNNATVAMVTTQRWREREGFRMLPFDPRTDAEREIIEVYPALVKRDGVPVPRARALLPTGPRDGSDEQDAAICALFALAHLEAGDVRLPPLVSPCLPLDEIMDGWIYAPPRSWIDGA